MKKLITLLAIVLIYTLSAWHNYKFVQRAYSKGGIAEKEQIEWSMMLLVFTPGINTLTVLALHITEYCMAHHTFNNFFNVKK